MSTEDEYEVIIAEKAKQTGIPLVTLKSTVLPFMGVKKEDSP